jgi:predicted dehydrogenase
VSEDRECRGDASATISFPAPELDYLPPLPQGPVPGIALIGCGGIAPYHLRAYREAGWPVRALCSRTPAHAVALRNDFFPEAEVITGVGELLQRSDIGVVDLATHPQERVPLIEAALNAGKHVLSQKPFVLDLDEGRRLVQLADDKGLHLAVNQNGRWAPHFCWIRKAVAAGLVGRVMAAHCAVHWDHNWTAGTAFDDMRHLVLADFGIHWFDMLTQLLPGHEARSVYATATHAPGQLAKPPLLAQALLTYDNAQASLVFDANTRIGALDETIVIGTEGTLRSTGPDLTHQTVTLTTAQGVATPMLDGDWFTNGFAGTMGELLCAFEQGRPPENHARHSLPGLALSFAATASADTGQAVVPNSFHFSEV